MPITTPEFVPMLDGLDQNPPAGNLWQIRADWSLEVEQVPGGQRRVTQDAVMVNVNPIGLERVTQDAVMVNVNPIGLERVTQVAVMIAVPTGAIYILQPVEDLSMFLPPGTPGYRFWHGISDDDTTPVGGGFIYTVAFIST